MSDLISRAALFNACATLQTKDEIFAAIQSAEAVEAFTMEEYEALTAEHQKTFREVIERYGVRSQLNIAVEEMAELSVALLHYLRCRGTVESITEEMADVFICLNQLILIMDNDKAVGDMMMQKIARLRDRLDRGGIL